MMKKIFICLCLLCLCACSQSSMETDTTDNNEVVQTEDNIEDTQTSKETIDDEETDDTETSTTVDTASNTTNNNTDSSSNDNSTNTEKSSSNTSSSQSSSNKTNTTTNSQSSTDETTQESKIYCTYTIDCSSILNNLDALESNYQVPSNGIIYSQSVEIQEDDTVMSILKRIGVTTDISLGYVKGIDGLYEFDCGSESGWTYSVNGTKPSVGASKYSVSEGDNIQWIYVVTRSEW